MEKANVKKKLKGWSRKEQKKRKKLGPPDWFSKGFFIKLKKELVLLSFDPNSRNINYSL